MNDVVFLKTNGNAVVEFPQRDTHRLAQPQAKPTMLALSCLSASAFAVAQEAAPIARPAPGDTASKQSAAGKLDYKDAALGTDVQGDASGTPIPGAPSRTATSCAQWAPSVGNGELYVRPALNYCGGYYNAVVDAGEPIGFDQMIAGRTLLNLRTGYTVGNATLSPSAQTLTHKQYFTSYANSVSRRKVDVPPRTLAVEADGRDQITRSRPAAHPLAGADRLSAPEYNKESA